MKSASNESFQSELSQAFASGQSSVALEVTELHKFLYAYSQRHWLSDGFLGKVIETSTRFLRAAYFWTIDKLFNFQVSKQRSARHSLCCRNFLYIVIKSIILKHSPIQSSANGRVYQGFTITQTSRCF